MRHMPEKNKKTRELFEPATGEMTRHRPLPPAPVTLPADLDPQLNAQVDPKINSRP